MGEDLLHPGRARAGEEAEEAQGGEAEPRVPATARQPVEGRRQQQGAGIGRSERQQEEVARARVLGRQEAAAEVRHHLGKRARPLYGLGHAHPAVPLDGLRQDLEDGEQEDRREPQGDRPGGQRAPEDPQHGSHPAAAPHDHLGETGHDADRHEVHQTFGVAGQARQQESGGEEPGRPHARFRHRTAHAEKHQRRERERDAERPLQPKTHEARQRPRRRGDRRRLLAAAQLARPQEGRERREKELERGPEGERQGQRQHHGQDVDRVVGRRLRGAGERIAAEEEWIEQRPLPVGVGMAHGLVPGNDGRVDVLQDAGAGADVVLVGRRTERREVVGEVVRGIGAAGQQRLAGEGERQQQQEGRGE